MYNTKAICTYNTLDVFLETDNVLPVDTAPAVDKAE